MQNNVFAKQKVKGFVRTIWQNKTKDHVRKKKVTPTSENLIDFNFICVGLNLLFIKVLHCLHKKL